MPRSTGHVNGCRCHKCRPQRHRERRNVDHPSFSDTSSTTSMSSSRYHHSDGYSDAGETNASSVEGEVGNQSEQAPHTWSNGTLLKNGMAYYRSRRRPDGTIEYGNFLPASDIPDAFAALPYNPNYLLDLAPPGNRYSEIPVSTTQYNQLAFTSYDQAHPEPPVSNIEIVISDSDARRRTKKHKKSSSSKQRMPAIAQGANYQEQWSNYVKNDPEWYKPAPTEQWWY